MKKPALAIALIALATVAPSDVGQLLKPSKTISVYEAVQDGGPKLFNALQGVFDGLYGGDVNAIEVPSDVIAHHKEVELPSAYVLAGDSRNPTLNPFYDFFDDRDPLPSFSSVMITTPIDPAAQLNPDRLGYQPVYNTPGLTGYGPEPTVGSQSTGDNGYNPYRTTGQ